MKKILIFMLVLPVYILAIDVSQDYSNAVNAYKKNDFATSYDLLSKLYLTKLSDAQLNFYYGRSAYETGHYEVALAAFERVEMMDPTSLRNKLEMARTYFMLKMYEDAELAFKEVLANPNIPKNLKTNIVLYLSKSTRVQQKSFTYASVNVDLVYDSNVNYGSLGGEYNTDSSTTPLPSSERTDRALQLYADIVNIYDIGEKSGFAIKNRVSLFLKDYKRLDAYDVKYFSYTPSIIYQYTKYLGEFSIGLDTLALGDKEYLRSISFSPRLAYSHTSVLKSIAYIKYKKKHFMQSAEKDLDANHYEFGYSLQSILSPRSYIQANIVETLERRINGSRIDVDYNEPKVSVVYANQFTAVYGAELFAQYRRRAYINAATTLYHNKRVDDAGTISATLNVKILNTLRFHLIGNYSRVESNQDRFTYQKYTVTAGINKAF